MSQSCVVSLRKHKNTHRQKPRVLAFGRKQKVNGKPFLVSSDTFALSEASSKTKGKHPETASPRDEELAFNVSFRMRAAHH